MGTNHQAGWTPIYDGVADEHGIITAAVFGIICRYCQMREKVCRASIASLAARLGINRVTVMRHIDLLQAEGLIRDLSPELRNRPHVYVVTMQAAKLISGGVTRGNTIMEDGCKQQEIEKYLEVDLPISDNHEELTSTCFVSQSNTEIRQDVTESDSAGCTSNSGHITEQQLVGAKSDMNQTLPGDPIQGDKRKRAAAKEMWRTIRAQLEPEVGPKQSQIHVYPTQAISWDENTLILGVRDEESLQWFGRFMNAAILKWLSLLTGAPKNLEIIVLSDG